MCFAFPTVLNPEVPEVPEDNAIPESSPSPADKGRVGPEMPGNSGEQSDTAALNPETAASDSLQNAY